MSKKYTITTPIYYVNSVPHIGTATTTLLSDVQARFQRLTGKEVHFMTGTDENAIKVLEAAEKAGKPTLEFVDNIADDFQKIWKEFKISFDDFIRTTEPRHHKGVYRLFNIIKENGYIYQDKYEGWYDVSSETFYKESDLVDGKSPDGNEVRWVSEENWFFKLSAFEQPILDHIKKNPDFIVPENRKNEVISFINQGLRDVCITRKSQGWGIQLEDDSAKVFYVWFDALINYLVSCGWPDSADWTDKWPAATQWMGKDILTRFHATMWPAMLMAAKLPLPKQMIGHGWLLIGGEKISKSKGNVVAPVELAKYLSEVSGCSYLLAIDAVRYYMAICMPFENDVVFTEEDFFARYNSDLANDIGNVLNRTLTMVHKFSEGTIPDAKIDAEAIDYISNCKKEYQHHIDNSRIDLAAKIMLNCSRWLNKYIDTKAPWALAKEVSIELNAVLRTMVYMLRNIEGFILSIAPDTASIIAKQLKLDAIKNWNEVGTEALAPINHTVGSPEPMFPRLDLKEMKKNLKESSKEDKKIEKQNKKDVKKEDDGSNAGLIDIKHFAEVKLRIGTIELAEDLEGSDKLLRLEVNVGDAKKQILAGIKNKYNPEALIGKQVVVVANLKPAKLRGHLSEGMLLAATDKDGSAVLIHPAKEMETGSEVR